MADETWVEVRQELERLKREKYGTYDAMVSVLREYSTFEAVNRSTLNRWVARKSEPPHSKLLFRVRYAIRILQSHKSKLPARKKQSLAKRIVELNRQLGTIRKELRMIARFLEE